MRTVATNSVVGETEHPGESAEWWRPLTPTTANAAAPGLVPSREGNVAFGALLLFTFILLLSPQTMLPILARMRIALLAGGFAILAHCWSRFAAKRPLMRVTRETWLVGGLFIWSVATLPLSEWPGGSLKILLEFYIKALIIFWVLSNTVVTLPRLRAVAWSLSLIAVPLAITGVRHFLAQSPLGRIEGYDAALTRNPNDLALMLNLILPLTIALFLLSHRKITRALLAGVIMLDVSAIIVSFSRAGFLMLLVILMLYLVTRTRRSRWQWAIVVLICAAAAIPFLPAGYLDRIATMRNISTDPTGSAQERWRDSKAAVVFALSHPLAGAGLGMNILALNELRGPRWEPVHNVYLEYAMDLGWPGLGLFVLLLASTIRTAGRIRAKSRGLPAKSELATLAEAVWIALMGFAVAAFFYPVAYHFYFFYFGALAVAAGAIDESEKRATGFLVGARV